MNKSFKVIGKIYQLKQGRIILEFDDLLQALKDADEKRRDGIRLALKNGAYNKILD